MVIVKLADCPAVTVALPLGIVTVSSGTTLTTLSIIVDELLGAYAESPPYTAVMICVPRVNAEVWRVAVAEPLSVPVPSGLTPSLNVTVPVGVGVPVPMLIVAVRVSGVATSVGFADGETEVVAAFLPTLTQASPAKPRNSRLRSV